MSNFKAKVIKIDCDYSFKFRRHLNSSKSVYTEWSEYFGEIIDVIIYEGCASVPIYSTIHMYEQGWGDIHLNEHIILD